MKIYTVGGAVRDALLGLEVKDRDHVVVGATPEQMLALGFTPVGKDFPVFLHPETHEEYALARTERKTAPGYKGFVFHTDPAVTLEQDLVRRDLTINAMALAEDGSLIDPHGGRRDLEARRLRHVSDAFAEDPVRILRLARFAARFEGFSVAPETMALMTAMVEAGEVDALVAERVWQEFAKGLMARRPSRMFEVLRECGALARLLPGLALGARLLGRLDAAAEQGGALPVRWALIAGGAGDEALARALCERLKAPAECRDLAVLLARERAALAGSGAGDAQTLLALLERCDALRRPGRFAELVAAAGLLDEASATSAPRLHAAVAVVRAVDAGAVARATPDRGQIPARVHAARLEALAGAGVKLRG